MNINQTEDHILLFEALVHNVVHEARQIESLSRERLTRDQLDQLIRKHDNNDMDQDSFIMACQEIEGILRKHIIN
jgi:hypothetical protein